MKPMLLTALAGLAACSASRADPSPGDKFEDDMMTRFHMHENFGLAHELERNLIAGRLDDAKLLARGLAQAPDESGFAAFAKHAAQVRVHAAAIERAKTLDEALGHDAQLLGACASCHVATSAQPEFRRWPPEPTDTSTIPARMTRHLWAAERLWEGMVGDADASWRAGLDMIAATPLPNSELDAARQPFAKKLQALAAEARKRPTSIDLATRTTTYADILRTCAACHTTKKPTTPF